MVRATEQPAAEGVTAMQALAIVLGLGAVSIAVTALHWPARPGTAMRIVTAIVLGLVLIVIAAAARLLLF